MIVWLALSTHTAPRDWWREDDATLATAIELLTPPDGEG
jgi:hypothetical protein